VGAYSEMNLQEDINNIVAIECIHTIWIHPPHFVGRNAILGLETWGRNFEHEITRCILFDLTENKKNGIPMGLVFIPIYKDKEFEKVYTEKKWKQVDGLLRGDDISGLVDARFRIAKKLSSSKLFQEATNNTMRLAIARKFCPFGIPDSAVKEIMALAKLSVEQLDEMMNMEKDSDIADITEEDLGFSDDPEVWKAGMEEKPTRIIFEDDVNEKKRN